jgi:hypothetical protein
MPDLKSSARIVARPAADEEFFTKYRGQAGTAGRL